MLKFCAVLALTLKLASAGIVNFDSFGKDAGHLSLENYHAGSSSGFQPSSHSSFGGGESAHNSYEGVDSYSAGGQHQEVGDGGDYHKGVSIIGGGNEPKATSFDLTNHGGGGGGGHQGLFGGSFVASGKYEGQGHSGGGGGGHGHETYASFGEGHLSDVLGADEHQGGGGGGGAVHESHSEGGLGSFATHHQAW